MPDQRESKYRLNITYFHHKDIQWTERNQSVFSTKLIHKSREIIHFYVFLLRVADDAIQRYTGCESEHCSTTHRRGRRATWHLTVLQVHVYVTVSGIPNYTKTYRQPTHQTRTQKMNRCCHSDPSSDNRTPTAIAPIPYSSTSVNSS